jgi:adenosylmethionine-8-amino-7-oxononanoate aminotransferase
MADPGQAIAVSGSENGGGSTRVPDTRLWHSQAMMPAVRHHERLIVRGEGAYVWDEHGNRLLDATASLWYCNVGHGRAEIADAVDAQMRVLETYHSFQQFATKPAVALADRLAAMAPIDDPRIFLTSGGGDSVEAAAKLSRRYWDVVGRPQKRVIVSRELCYHGLHGFGTGIAGLEFNRTGQGELVPDAERVATNDAEAFASLVAERGADSIAAFFCEPIVGAGGVIHPADGYLEHVQQICRENDILFVVDEVITGFGRAGEMFASDRYGIEPDIMLMAKGVTSGYLPLGAIAVAEPVWAPFWNQDDPQMFHHGITYSGHASACAAAMANLDILEREELPQRSRSLERPLADALAVCAADPRVSEVRAGVGLLAAIEFHDPAHASAAAERCLDAGVILRVIANGALQVSPPLMIEEADIALLAEVLASEIDQLS